MKIALHVTAPPYSSEANLSAYNFVTAALRQDHTVTRVFFSSDAVITGSALTVPPQDELNLYTAWAELGIRHNIELILCVSACLRRGIIDHTEAERYELDSASLRKPFIISGLGQLAEAAVENDRLITFGN